jgi:hypothetical protein
VVKDFRDMKAMGCNLVRLHLQLGRFMVDANTADKKSLAELKRVLALADEVGMYLDVTGLACYRTKDVPAWYDAMGEADRWAVQARFWEAVAAGCAGHPAVFCYDLINEPVVPAGRRKPGQWYSGHLLGDFDFLQWIALDQAGRKREEIARDWVRMLTAAIRKHDKEHMITVGMLPPSEKLGIFSGFLPKVLAPELDFICVHIYPRAGKVDEALEFLSRYAVGKPVVIEETFNLRCGVADLEMFLRKSKGTACGWVGHYGGLTPADFEALRKADKLTLSHAFMEDFLKLFVKLGPHMQGP